MEAVGIDIGGSGIKGARVDLLQGELCSDRVRIPTPQPATPEAVAGTVAEVVRQLEWQGPVGCGYPGVIIDGVVRTAAHVSDAWLGVNARDLFAASTGCSCTVANDADAAGLAEMRFGAGRERPGTVLVLTLGTGIGSALFIDGKLYPNTELGHVEVNGIEAELWASAKVREEEDLKWSKWSERLDIVIERLHAHLWPELIILGGGVSRKHEKFLHRLTSEAEIVPAQLRNQAGIVGAAMLAAEAGGLIG